MKTFKLIFPFILLFTFLSCQDCDDDISMIYIETKCADPWQTGEGNSDDEVLTAVEDYLSDLDIDFDDLEIYFDETYAEDCEACVCTSGRVIRLEAEEDQVDELQVEGFVIE